MGATLSTLSLETLKSFPLSWRALVLLFVLTNWKSLPGAWTVRIWYQLVTSFRHSFRLTTPNTESRNPKKRLALIKKSSPTDPISNHALFRVDTVTSHAPLLEIDYNMHKSNSTYFADLDASRAKLMARIIAPIWHGMQDMLIDYKASDGTIKWEKVNGRQAVILGAVHTSFRREIKPYVKYDIQTRVLGWDSRWIYLGSWFVAKSGKGKGMVLASSLSKYIFKKGRITIRPELFLTEAGWIPKRPEGVPTPKTLLGSSSGVATPEPAFGESSATKAVDNAKELTQRAAANVLEATSEKLEADAASMASLSDSWTWEEVETERARGMDVVRGWALTDGLLEEEFTRGR